MLDSNTIPDAESAAVPGGALQALFDLAGSNQVAEPAAAVSCIKAPNGRSVRGTRWRYRTDDATGERCWWLSGQISKAQVVKPQVAKPQISNAGIWKAEISRSRNLIPAASPEPGTLVAPETPAAALAQFTADARAEFLDGFKPPVRRIEPAPLPRPVTTKLANTNPATASFASRWIDSSEHSLSGDRQQVAAGYSEIDRLVPIVFDDVTHSTKTSGRLFTAERSLYITVIVFLASLGGVLVLFALIGGAFLYVRALYRRSSPPVRPNPPPRGNVLRNDSPPVRPAETTGEIAADGDPSSPDTPAAIKRAGVRRNDAEVRQRAECDRKPVVGGPLRQPGSGQTGRDSPRGQRQAGVRLRQFDEIECV